MKKFLMVAVALTAFSVNAATTETTTSATTETTTATTAEKTKEPAGCKTLKDACTTAGYSAKKDAASAAAEGKGLYRDCVDAYLAGETVANLDTTKIKTDNSEACKAHRAANIAKNKEERKTARAATKASTAKAATTAPAATTPAPATTAPATTTTTP